LLKPEIKKKESTEKDDPKVIVKLEEESEGLFNQIING
jgi:hypothetical protein